MFLLSRYKYGRSRQILGRVARTTIGLFEEEEKKFADDDSRKFVSLSRSEKEKERRRRTNNRACSSSSSYSVREFQTSAIAEARPGQNRSPSGAGKPKKFNKKKLPPASVGATEQQQNRGGDERGGDKAQKTETEGAADKSKQPFTSVYRKIKVVGKGTVRKKVERVVEKKEVKAKAAVERRHVRINEGSTVNEIAKAFGIESEQIIKLLEALGDSTSLSIEESVAADSIELIAAELDVDITIINNNDSSSSGSRSSSSSRDSSAVMKKKTTDGGCHGSC